MEGRVEVYPGKKAARESKRKNNECLTSAPMRQFSVI